MRARAADQRDIENVEAWAEIVADALFLAPPDRRAEILALAVQNEEVEQRDRDTNGPFKVVKYADINLNTPRHRHWNVIMRLKSLIVQVFVRDVTNDHSPDEAENLLFARQRFGAGSAYHKSVWGMSHSVQRGGRGIIR